MAEEVIIPRMGIFKISDSFNEVTDILCKTEVEVGRSILKVGEETDLDGYYNIAKPIYAGYIDHNDSKILYFYFGVEPNIFGEKHYFQLINLITKNRIYITFSHSGGRDFNFINGKWK